MNREQVADVWVQIADAKGVAGTLYDTETRDIWAWSKRWGYAYDLRWRGQRVHIGRVLEAIAVEAASATCDMARSTGGIVQGMCPWGRDDAPVRVVKYALPCGLVACEMMPTDPTEVVPSLTPLWPLLHERTGLALIHCMGSAMRGERLVVSRMADRLRVSRRTATKDLASLRAMGALSTTRSPRGLWVDVPWFGAWYAGTYA